MNKAFWGVFVLALGITAMLIIVFFQQITNTDEHNSQLLKEVTEAAMWDAYDYAHYRKTSEVKIDEKKFVDNFVRRFADAAQSNRNYKIEFMDVNEMPPKVSIRVTSTVSNAGLARLTRGDEETYNFDLTNSIDAILETPY